MSKITKPDAEYNVSCGFFNSDSTGTRKYDATDFSKLFDGMVTDGVFASIGDCLIVKAGSGTTVNVGSGKCWFNHTWTLNNDVLPITCDASDPLLNRIDAIVLEVNTSQSVRDNCFEYIKGVPASEPKKPTLTNTNLVHQHALCYITRPAGSTTITQANIENVVGTEETPFITALLKTVSVDELLGQWRAQLDDFLNLKQTEVETFIEVNEKEYDDSIASKEQEVDERIDTLIAANEAAYAEWSNAMKTEMESLVSEVRIWYEGIDVTVDEYLTNIKNKLTGDSAVALQLQIDEHDIKSILLNGFVDGTKTISVGGDIITSTDSVGRTLVQTFTNNFLTTTSVLKDRNGSELGRLVKNVSSDGSTITSEITLL